MCIEIHVAYTQTHLYKFIYITYVSVIPSFLLFIYYYYKLPSLKYDFFPAWNPQDDFNLPTLLECLLCKHISTKSTVRSKKDEVQPQMVKDWHFKANKQTDRKKRKQKIKEHSLKSQVQKLMLPLGSLIYSVSVYEADRP